MYREKLASFTDTDFYTNTKEELNSNVLDRDN